MSSVAFTTLVGKFRDMSEKEILAKLSEGYRRVLGDQMDPEEKAAWRGALPKLQRALEDVDDEITLALEYKLPFSSERIDMVLIGRSPENRPEAVIVELKGWHKIIEAYNDRVRANGDYHQHPELQVLNYIGKLRCSHSAANLFKFTGVAWLYNLPKGALTFRGIKAFWNRVDEFTEFLAKELPYPPKGEEVNAFINGYYRQTAHLLQAIKRNFRELRRGSLRALCATGWGLSEEQQLLIEDVLESLHIGEKDVCYLVRGPPGSGKSYLAVLLLLKALRDFQSIPRNQNVAILGYRNNRLINTIRRVFNECERGLGNTLLKFYSTGRGFGLAEGDPAYPHFRLAIYDEAQRMTKTNIEIAMQRGDITVFFYDDTQILNAEEQGWRENFLEVANKLGIDVREWELKGVYRVQGGALYHDFVEQLLKDPAKAKFPYGINYDFQVFDDIGEMLKALREKANKLNTRVALVASFTESPGDRKNKDKQTLLNRRVGYPLYSGFDHYKNIDIEIYWLMDERKQYPDYWYKGISNRLTHCASIYGCQGFEADYVGVIWGRDMVYRNGEWTLGENCEDDVGKPSLKELFRKAKEKNDKNAYNLALKLLKNRYRIFLTRGIHGTYVYCEDEGTVGLLRSIFQQDA